MSSLGGMMVRVKLDNGRVSACVRESCVWVHVGVSVARAVAMAGKPGAGELLA